MPLNVLEGPGTVTFEVVGCCDHQIAQEFEEAFDSVDPTTSYYAIDLARSTGLTMGGLGAMLVLRGLVQARGAEVVLLHPSRSAVQVIETVNFQRLFQMVK